MLGLLVAKNWFSVAKPHSLDALASALMAVLGRQAILNAIDRGAITITPFDPLRVGPASVDLTLANSFRVFRKVHEVVDVDEHTDYRSFTEKVDLDEGDHILIMPGETILGITQERLQLSPGLCGWLEGRSRFARLGLMVHISAPFMGPGIDSQQVLEMSNFGPAPLAVHPGTPICQFIFQTLEERSSTRVVLPVRANRASDQSWFSCATPQAIRAPPPPSGGVSL